MEYRSKSNGLLTFIEHWWFLSIAITAILASQVLGFFMRLSGTPWIWCYGIGLAIAAVGVYLIVYAKLPLYQQRRFLTFGSRALPERRRPFYRWGYRCVLFAVALLLCLFLSRP
jgi:MFS family permease